MHNIVLWVVLLGLMVVGGATIATNAGESHVAGEASPVSLYRTQTVTDAWLWHHPALLSQAWFGVVTNTAARQVLLNVHPYLQDRLPADVDWAREVLVVAALGEVPTGGYAVRVTAVNITTNSIEVHLALRSPGPTDFVTQMITYPADVVRLSRQKLPQNAPWVFYDQYGQRLTECQFPQ